MVYNPKGILKGNIVLVTGGFGGQTIWVSGLHLYDRMVQDSRPFCLFFLLIGVTVCTPISHSLWSLIVAIIVFPLLLRSAIGTGGCRGM